MLPLLSCNQATQKEIERAENRLQTENNCVCAEIWQPVCGDDGVTYSNTCFSKCAGVEAKPGECGN